MAEFKFPCSSCGQNIKVDELWSGHQLECPACHAQITVPANPAAAAARPAQVRVTTAAPAAVAVARAPTGPPPVPPGPPKLAIGAHKESEAPKAAPVVRNFVEKAPKKKSSAMQALITVLILAILGGGGWFGYDYYQKRKAAKEAEEARQAAEAEEARKAAEAAAHPPPPKELPIVAPVYTLDAAQAKIPEGKANGTLSGNNFLVDSARIDKVGASYVLGLRQGTGPSPDRELLVYLHLKPGDGPSNQTITVTADTRNPLVSQVAKLWKTDPKYAPQRKNFFTGYALKLELGKMTDNAVDSKIFLALPDNEKSVVGGAFRAAMGQTADVTEQAPAQTATPRNDPVFDRRYGIRR